MKTAGNIVTLIAVVLFTSCIKDSATDDGPPATRGLMQVEVTENAGLAEDKIETVRFLVFDNATAAPKLELNELFDVPAIQPGDDEVSKLKVTLEVGTRRNGRDDKMVVAIVNEPAPMKNTLDAIVNYMQLRDLKLDFADFLNSGHNALQSGKTMPMTGVTWTNKVYATPEEAESDPAALTVYRAAARVDVYIRKETGLDFDLAEGSNIVLGNTYDREYFIRNETGGNSFGQIQTVSSGLISKSHTVTSTDPKEIPGSGPGSERLVCSFYTPERTCTAAGNADKLSIDLDILTSEGANRTGKVVVDRFLLEGTETDVDVIARNNIYRVIVTVGANGLTARVLDWNSEEIETEF